MDCLANCLAVADCLESNNIVVGYSDLDRYVDHLK